MHCRRIWNMLACSVYRIRLRCLSCPATKHRARRVDQGEHQVTAKQPDWLVLVHTKHVLVK